MPTRVVVVHDEPVFASSLTEVLTEAGYAVTAFANPRHALEAMRAAGRIVGIDLLITRYRFGTPQPIGPSLVRLAKAAHPEMAVIFVAQPEFRENANGMGEFIAAPASVEDVMSVVARLVPQQD